MHKYMKIIIDNGGRCWHSNGMDCMECPIKDICLKGRGSLTDDEFYKRKLGIAKEYIAEELRKVLNA
jgi:hypothetical protein